MGDLVLFLPFLALFGVIIYMQTRQRKKMQANQAELQAALHVGAPIMLTSGLHGEVAGLDETTVDVEISPGVVARFARAAVLEVRSSGLEELEGTAEDGNEAEGETDDVDRDDVQDVDPEDDEASKRPGSPTLNASSARVAKPLAHDDPSG